MKKIIFLVLAVAAGYASHAQTAGHFGKEITEQEAVSASTLPKLMGDKEQMPAKVSGTVESVCQAKGCWMKVKMDNGETMRVMFRDYAFFVPKDIAGKNVVIEGDARKETTSVKLLQHYAKDAGKSTDEIAKITEPKQELTFIADGVIIK